MSASDPRRLDGWKSIAAYLGRDARTAQRWHHDRGMPVHHVPGSRCGAVFAFAGEIDDWLTHGALSEAQATAGRTARGRSRRATAVFGALAERRDTIVVTSVVVAALLAGIVGGC